MNYTDQIIETALLDDNAGQVAGLPANPATVTQGRYEACRDAMAKDDIMLKLRQIVVYPFEGRYVVICGHTRVRAARELGITHMPARVMNANTPVSELKELAVKSNVDYGEFDVASMQADYDMRTILDCGLDASQFEFEFDKEVASIPEKPKLKEPLPNNDVTDDDETPDEPEIDRSALPEEIRNENLDPPELPVCTGDDVTLYERLVISYPASRRAELEAILGVQIDKIVYHVAELKEPVEYAEEDAQ